MSKLTDLVPPLELCKEIPAGAFEDSALVWSDEALDSPIVEPRGYAPEEFEECPAPTLAEIMLALDEAGYWCPTCYYQAGTWHMDCEDQTIMDAEDNYNAATAALKLWLDLSVKEKNA